MQTHYEDPNVLFSEELDFQPKADIKVKPSPWFPLLLAVSGRYVRRALLYLPYWPMDGVSLLSEEAVQQTASGANPLAPPQPIPFPIHQPMRPLWRIVEEICLDVDRNCTQTQVSGVVNPGLRRTPLNWIAKLVRVASYTWEGRIWYKEGDATLLPQLDVRVVATPVFATERKAAITFSGGGVPAITREYTYVSPYFRKVEFEYDHVENSHPVFEIDTGSHPNHPAALPHERLTIEEVYRRTGFEVSRSLDSTVIPLADAGADARWSDQEMHDAMQKYWSRFADKPQWALWVFWAALHQQGTNLGGIMFDDIGPNHRQGTAIFTDSFISIPPPGDAHADAAVARMRFWTAVHEMGHAFNLAHSWQKEMGTPWIRLVNEPEARSFMNYPYYVSGGQTAFFSDFAYRFSDQELLFLRHAPERFVQMGNADWFDHHGFEGAANLAEPQLALEARVNRQKPVFEFLEPVVVEIKAKNISGRPMVVDSHLLEDIDDLTVIVKRDRQPARQWRPFATRCIAREETVLSPGQALYNSLFIAAGVNGWDVAEPGRYLVQVCLHHEGQDVVSKPLLLHILPPRGHEEEALAQDVFTEDVGRVLAFDGSRVLTDAVDTLQRMAETLQGRPAARHALVALGMSLATPGKILSYDTEKSEIRVAKPDIKEADQALTAALLDDRNTAAETLGHIDYTSYVSDFSTILVTAGQMKKAEESLTQLESTLTARNVLPSVVAAVRRKRETIGKER